MKHKKLIEVAPLLSATAAACSAIAAIFSAIAASTNATNARLAARPVIQPSGWTLTQVSDDRAEIRFKYLENKGQGPATLVIASLDADYPHDRQRPSGLLVGTLTPSRMERLNPGERVAADFYGTFPWTIEKKCKSVYLRVGIRSTDQHGNRWLTNYGLLAFKTPRTNCVAALEEVAPNLHYLGIIDDGPVEPGKWYWLLWLVGAAGIVLMTITAVLFRRRRSNAVELNAG